MMMPIWPCNITVQCPRDQLWRHGPLIPGWWVSPTATGIVQPSEGSVLVDTGASEILIDEAIAEALKLPVHDEKEFHGVHGSGNLRNYLAKLVLPVTSASGEQFALGVPVVCGAMPEFTKHYARDGFSVVGILGRTFLQFCNLEIDGLAGRVSLRIDESSLLPLACSTASDGERP